MINNIIRSCTTFLAGIILLGSLLIVFNVHVRAATDTTPPKITDISIDKTIAHVGDTVTFSITVEEEETGFTAIRAGMGITQRDKYLKNTAGNFSVSSIFDKEQYTGTYQISRVVTEDDAPGIYQFNDALIQDVMYNMNHYSFFDDDESGRILKDTNSGDQFTIPKTAQLTIINDDYDDYRQITSSSIRSVEIKSHDISYDETIPVDVLFEGEVPETFDFHITFENPLTHDGGRGAYSNNISGNDCAHEGLLYHLNLKPSNGINKWRSGNYQIGGVSISEKGKDLDRIYSNRDGNNYLYEEFDGSLYCEIVGDDLITYTEDPSIDRTAPVFESVKVHQEMVTRPGIVTIDVDISDDIRVTQSYVNVYKDGTCIVGAMDSSHIHNEGPENQKDLSGQLKLYVPREAPLGKCQLVIFTYDSTGNKATYTVDFEIVDEL